jgi:hypothetical protein
MESFIINSAQRSRRDRKASSMCPWYPRPGAATLPPPLVTLPSTDLAAIVKNRLKRIQYGLVRMRAAADMHALMLMKRCLRRRRRVSVLRRAGY